MHDDKLWPGCPKKRSGLARPNGNPLLKSGRKDVIRSLLYSSTISIVDLLSDICWHSLLWAEVGFLCKKGSLFSIFSSWWLGPRAVAAAAHFYLPCVWCFMGFWPQNFEICSAFDPQRFNSNTAWPGRERCCCFLLCKNSQAVCPCKNCTKWFITSFLPPCLAFFYQKIFAFYSNTTNRSTDNLV